MTKAFTVTSTVKTESTVLAEDAEAAKIVHAGLVANGKATTSDEKIKAVRNKNAESAIFEKAIADQVKLLK